MSNLGDNLEKEYGKILELKTNEETPDGEPGDDWSNVYENFLWAVKKEFSNAAPETIRNKRGEITAPVDNPHTKSDKLYVGNSSAIKAGPIGDEGEYIPLATLPFRGLQTTTSTAYTRLNDSNTQFVFDSSVFDLTNIGNIYYQFTGNVDNDTDGETFTVRPTGLSNATITSETSGGILIDSSAIVKADSEPIQEFFIEGKVTDGTGYLRGGTIHVYGEVQ